MSEQYEDARRAAMIEAQEQWEDEQEEQRWYWDWYRELEEQPPIVPWAPKE